MPTALAIAICMDQDRRSRVVARLELGVMITDHWCYGACGHSAAVVVIALLPCSLGHVSSSWRMSMHRLCGAHDQHHDQNEK